MPACAPYPIVLIFILATIITPTPDVLTLVALSLAICLLYESCIWIAFPPRSSGFVPISGNQKGAIRERWF